jgi:hypothetical protein
MSTSLAIRLMLNKIADLPADTPLTIVLVKRYSDRDWLGVHLVTSNDPMAGPRWNGHRNLVVGMFDTDDAMDAYKLFLEGYQVTSANAPYSGQEAEIKEYIATQVLPTGWQSEPEEWLDQQLTIAHGRALATVYNIHTSRQEA